LRWSPRSWPCVAEGGPTSERRRLATALLVVATLALSHAPRASAHAALRLVVPADGAALPAAPDRVRLTFTEPPDPALSTIQVRDAAGLSWQSGSSVVDPADSLTLVASLTDLPPGVYIVQWRVVSSVDGHATSGVNAFGVMADPAASMASTPAQTMTSMLEAAARLVWWLGMLVMVGAVAARLLRFGGDRDSAIAGLGWVAAVVGLALLMEAQRRSSGASFANLLGSSVGDALLARAAAVGITGAGLCVSVRDRSRQGLWTTLALLAAIAGVVVHAAAGHAAAHPADLVSAVFAQSLHAVTAGVWFGGLLALLAALSTRPPDGHARIIRFSTVALISVIALVLTGITRSVQELTMWSDLWVSSYGRVLLAKIALTAVLCVAGAYNRLVSVPRAATSLRPLRRVAITELALALLAVAAAGLLGATAPPVSGSELPSAISVTANDFARTVRIQLVVTPAQPGPNRFTLHVTDYDSGRHLENARAALRFESLDDPGIDPTTLPLSVAPDGSFAGRGVNLSVDGGWRITAVVERGASSVEVPLQVDVLRPLVPRVP
jgi:copper transport protein